MKRALWGRGLFWALLAAGFWGGVSLAGPLTLYVAPDGNDDWSGGRPSVNRSKSDGPLATLRRAVEKSREAHRQTPEAKLRVELRGGVYELDQPLVLTPDDSGLAVAAYD